MSDDGTISLYFQLKPGEKVDLEVVALAALQWVEAMRLAARALDPDAIIRVEFVDADESSLRLNAVLEWIEKQLARIDEGSSKYPRLRRLALALAVFIPVSGIPTVIFYFGDSTVQLSDEDQRRLDELSELIRKVPEIEVKQRQFFRTLERDSSITGIGISEEPRGPLAILVPSSEFAERSGLWVLEEDQTERTLFPVLDVVLIQATLVAAPRSWTFQPEGLPEFTAIMKDKRFLDALGEAHVRENLRTGIQMTIRLEVKEKKIDGEWKVKRKGRSVIEVISPKVD